MLTTMMDLDDLTAAEQTIAHVLDQVERLYEEAAIAIRAIADPDEAFRYATRFAERVQAIHDEQETKLRQLRAEQAMRIRDEKALKLTELADRLGLSKQRMTQFKNDAAKQTARKG